MSVQLYAGTLGTPGVTSYLSSYPANNLPNVGSAVTFMGWFNSPAFGLGSPIASILGLYNGNNNAGTTPTTAIQIGAGQSGTANALDVWTWGGTILVSTGGSPGVPVGTWFHAAYTCTAAVSGTQTHTIYINGSVAGISTNALQVAGVPTQFYLNGFPQTAAVEGTYQESSTSLIDDARLYNRILSAAEIETIYNSRGERDGIVYGLVGNYSFLEHPAGGTVALCVDYSSNNNTLTTYNVGSSTSAPIYANSILNIDLRPPF